MAKNELLYVELVEKELVNTEIAEKELIRIALSTIDVIHSTASVENTILNETPVNINSLPSARFSVANAFVSGKIQIFLNGMKIHNSEIIFHSSTEFSYPLDIISTDMVEVAYIKQ